MEKIIVNPLEVRGSGNIIIPKTVSDFDRYNCNITSETDVVDEISTTVYRIDYYGITFLVTVSSNYVHAGGTVNVSVTVIDENGDPIEGAEIELYKETTE